MSDTVIRVENLGKKYIIGHQQQERYTALRDVLANKAKGMTQLFNPKSKIQNPKSEEFWALKDVSFEVKRGDRIGIIGRNGAGKSTLLKILSRITEPTEGRISIKGRVASLLEVGTGFHPELTGRENIFLNGAILGMSKVEIRRKFDEIVAFAEVEKFLDTPVKRYSSGMYVRLAFAVAAHLESEILIVDEVLAVGDYEFQKKCLGKMGEVSKGEGKTVLFVSHNLGSIQALCNQGILLDNGIVAFEGTVSAAIREYSSSYATNQKSVYTGTGIIREVRIINNIPVVRHNSDFHIEVKFHSKMPIKNLVVEVVIKDELDVAIVGVNNWHYMESRLHDKDLYDGVMNVIFKPLTILPGKYKLDIYVGDSMIDLETVSDALSFEVEDTKINSTDYPLDLRINKIFIPEVNWQLNHS